MRQSPSPRSPVGGGSHKASGIIITSGQGVLPPRGELERGLTNDEYLSSITSPLGEAEEVTHCLHSLPLGGAGGGLIFQDYETNYSLHHGSPFRIAPATGLRRLPEFAACRPQSCRESRTGRAGSTGQHQQSIRPCPTYPQARRPRTHSRALRSATNPLPQGSGQIACRHKCYDRSLSTIQPVAL